MRALIFGAVGSWASFCVMWLTIGGLRGFVVALSALVLATSMTLLMVGIHIDLLHSEDD